MQSIRDAKGAFLVASRASQELRIAEAFIGLPSLNFSPLRKEKVQRCLSRETLYVSQIAFTGSSVMGS